MSDSVRPHRRQPTRLPRPWDSPGKNMEWVAISFSNAWKWKVKVKSLSLIRLLATPWTAAYQAPPPMGFSRQQYWSGVTLPSPICVCVCVCVCVYIYIYTQIYIQWLFTDYYSKWHIVGLNEYLLNEWPSLRGLTLEEGERVNIIKLNSMYK